MASREPPEEVLNAVLLTELQRIIKSGTDTGIEISFPSNLTERPGYLEFSHESDGRGLPFQ